MISKIANYHEKVAKYYDEDVSLGFEQRAGENFILEKIRNDFRKITMKYPLNNTMEIGCGPGFDVVWFAKKHPEHTFSAVDISAEMVKLAGKRIKTEQLKNASVYQASEKELLVKFEHGSFDTIYVYFGALNTVEDLSETAGTIHQLLKPEGVAVLSFVNKWYLRELLVNFLKLKPRSAFARLGNTWGGYSPGRNLPSHCYSPSQIIKSFPGFKLLEKYGYSIFFPAWYNQHKIAGKIKKAEKRWNLDRSLQKTFLWSMGEYTLYVFQKGQ